MYQNGFFIIMLLGNLTTSELLKSFRQDSFYQFFTVILSLVLSDKLTDKMSNTISIYIIYIYMFCEVGFFESYLYLSNSFYLPIETTLGTIMT